ncbi:MAG: hypothetical protein F6K55_36630 [Moorea sp. SIO4A3]|nr:hypothetical protein [Moorena sp. SIO4A3]
MVLIGSRELGIGNRESGVGSCVGCVRGGKPLIFIFERQGWDSPPRNAPLVQERE